MNLIAEMMRLPSGGVWSAKCGSSSNCDLKSIYIHSIIVKISVTIQNFQIVTD